MQRGTRKNRKKGIFRSRLIAAKADALGMARKGPHFYGDKMDDLNLEDWLVSTGEKRSVLLAYAQSSIPTDPGERYLDISKALEHGQDAGDLLADLDKLLIDETAKAVLGVRRTNGELTADERKAMVKAEVSGIAWLRDGLQVIYSSIKDRRFVLMNLNRI